MSETEAPWSELGMSNFDHAIDDGLEDDLKAGMHAQHSAWNFCGEVFWDPERGLFVETIRRYGSVVGEASALTLQELMAEVNDAMGWE